MLLAHQVGGFYRDLQDPELESAIAMVHQRFSTNTFPTWHLAHPFRLIAHNGEINTLRGNVNWLRARQQNISSKLLGEGLYKIWPLIYDGQSDSASFDNALELLYFGGYSLAHAMDADDPRGLGRQPSSWTIKRRAFYEYHASADGALGRPRGHGLHRRAADRGPCSTERASRPARYVVTDDDLVILASEAGVLDVPERKIVKKWRLQPGKMLLIDLEEGRIVDDRELKDQLARHRPYQKWLDRTQLRLKDIPAPDYVPVPDGAKLLDRQQAFGYTQEDLKLIMAPMAAAGEPRPSDRWATTRRWRCSPTGRARSTPTSATSSSPRSLQPARIDPIREETVMSLVSFIGPRPIILGLDDSGPNMRLTVSLPILGFDDMEKVRRAEELDARPLPLGGALHGLPAPPGAPTGWRRRWPSSPPTPRTWCAAAA